MRARSLRLSRKVYRSCLLAALSAVLVCVGIFAGFAYNQVSRENTRNLQEEAAYIAHAVELSGTAYLRTLTPAAGSRVTWIAPDGRVCAMAALEDLVEDLVGTVRDGTHRA